MQRILALVPALCASLVGCDGDADGGAASSTPVASPRASAESPAATLPTTPDASPEARPIPPAWAAPVDEDLEPEDLPDTALVPPGADLTERITLPAAGGLPDQVAVTYVSGEDPFAAEHGFAVWQRFDEPPSWSVVSAFVDAPARGVLGIDLQAGDVTADGHEDVLTFEEMGGSGACGRWRVIVGATGGANQVFARKTCDTEIRLVEGALEVREAVFEPDDAHCCPSAFRYSRLEWNGDAFVETGVSESPAAPP